MGILRLYARFAATICATAVLSACAGGLTYQGAPTIPVAAILNGLKCELSGFYTKHKDYQIRALQLDPDKPSTVDLSLKVVSGNEAGLGIETGVLPFLGASFGPSFSFGVENSQTITTTVTFDMQQKAARQLDCRNIAIAVRGLALRDWLEQYFKDQANIVKGEPGVGLGTVVLDTNFGVTISAGFKGDLQFHPVQLATSAAAARQDIQSLRITFRGPFTKAPEYGKGDVVLPHHYLRRHD
jgi:hypothetical protein